MKRKFKISIDLTLCKKCGICEYICSHSVFKTKEAVLLVYDERCTGCYICELICPDCAISVTRLKEENETAHSRK
jgi:NAD-dependent dihydropyrimidine dehydrogenase PreA subunit